MKLTKETLIQIIKEELSEVDIALTNQHPIPVSGVEIEANPSPLLSNLNPLSPSISVDVLLIKTFPPLVICILSVR